MNDILKALRETQSEIFGFIQRHFGELIGIFLGCELLDQYFKHFGAEAAAMGYQNLGVPLGRLCVGMLLFVLLTMLIPLRDMQDRGTHGPMGLWTFSLVHLKPFTLESLRAMGWVLLFLPLLIIPGLVKYVQYIFIPYIVLCDPEYQAGRVDALEKSSRLAKGLVTIMLVALLLAIPVALWTAQFTEPILLTQQPLMWLLSFGLSSMLSLYFNLLLYRLYRVRMSVLRTDQGA